MTRAILRCLSVSGSVLLLALAARATIVVDAAGGGQFTSLQAAVLAAQDGEMILVKAGTYVTPTEGHLLIDGKGLSIHAEAGATVGVLSVTVRNVPAGHSVVLRGLTIDQGIDEPVSSGGALRVEGPGGTVWVEDCTIDAGKGTVLQGLGPHFFLAGPGVRATAGATLLLQRCTITGGEGIDSGSFLADKWQASAGLPGVLVEGSRVVMHHCTVRGGHGGDGEHHSAPYFLPASGGMGMKVLGDSFAHAAGSEVRGGDNGENTSFDDDQAGHGLEVLGSLASVWMRDSVFEPGQVVNQGLPGQAVFAPPATLVPLPSPARSFAVDSPLREGQAGTLQVQGVPGDQPVLLVGLGAGFAPLLLREGPLMLDAGVLLIVPLGTITDPGGALAVPFVAPALAPVLSGLTVPLQLAVSAGVATTLEASSALAWLDAGL